VKGGKESKSATQRVIVWLKQLPITFCVRFCVCEFLFKRGYLDSGCSKAACTRSKQFVAVALHPPSSSSFLSNLSTSFPQPLAECWQQIKSLITSSYPFLALYGNDYNGGTRKLVARLGLCCLWRDSPQWARASSFTRFSRSHTTKHHNR